MVESFRKLPPFVDDERLREANLVSLMPHMFEVTKGVRIRERAVLAPILFAVRTLWIVHAAARAAAVGAGEDAAGLVDIDAKRIAAPSAKISKTFVVG